VTLASEIESATTIDQVIAAVERSEQLVRNVATETQGALVNAVDQQFASGTDPYGNAWEGGPSYHGLIDSTDMLGTLEINVDGTELDFSMNDPARYHQSGTGRMPRRQIFPNDGEALPKSYQQALDAASRKVLGG
jgi:hypothetical protein